MLLSFCIKTSKNIFALFLMSLFLLPYATLAQESFDPSLYDEDGFLLDQQKFPEAEPSEFASSTLNEVSYSVNPEDITSGEIASCFDYYEFGSIAVNLSSDFDSYDGGNTAIITGSIKNNNPYPVVGLDIKARLVKDIPEPQPFRSDIMVLDEFNIADNITLDTGASYDVSYSYLLPLNAPSGQYQIYFYAVEQKRFNLSGLSFTNDIVASRIHFDVNGTTPDHVYLDQTQIMVGDEPHDVMAFMTHHDKNIPIPVTIPLYNSSSEDKQMNITYNLYSWDAANQANKIDTRMEQVTVPSRKDIPLSYTIPNPNIPVYYLNIIAEPTNPKGDTSVFDEKSISNIRLVVDNTSQTRLNFVGVNQYPLKAGTEATLVTCFHNTNRLENPENSKIETVLYTTNHKELARLEFNGKTGPDITGMIQKFTPSKDISEFIVESTLYDEKGNIVDKVEKKYSCKDINQNSCAPERNTSPLIALVLVAIIIGLIVLIYKRKTINLIRV